MSPGEGHGVEGYFAYGANMDPAVLRRRGLHPPTGVAARLDGYELRFTAPGLAWVEPGFATVCASEGEQVHGVFYRLSSADLDALDGFEGDQERFAVTVHTASGPVAATTYRSFTSRDGLIPSRRYLAILLHGARLHELPEAWVRWLEDRPTAYVPLLSEYVGLVIWLMERVRAFLRSD